ALGLLVLLGGAGCEPRAAARLPFPVRAPRSRAPSRGPRRERDARSGPEAASRSPVKPAQTAAKALGSEPRARARAMRGVLYAQPRRPSGPATKIGRAHV